MPGYPSYVQNNAMHKEILLQMLDQNRIRFWATFNKLTASNASLKLNEQTASAGFIYRHVSEIMNGLGTFLGFPSDVGNTTMGLQDHGQGKDLDQSRLLAERGFAMLEQCVENTGDEQWLELVDTPFFGPISRIRFFSHVLHHNSYHLGQVALTLARGKKMD
jgi:uncharacterized damage-inducible protein DinB